MWWSCSWTWSTIDTIVVVMFLNIVLVLFDTIVVVIFLNIVLVFGSSFLESSPSLTHMLTVSTRDLVNHTCIFIIRHSVLYSHQGLLEGIALKGCWTTCETSAVAKFEISAVTKRSKKSYFWICNPCSRTILKRFCFRLEYVLEVHRTCLLTRTCIVSAVAGDINVNMSSCLEPVTSDVPWIAW